MSFNGRAINGTYAYFLSSDNAGNLTYPYLLASRYYGDVPRPSRPGQVMAVRSGVTLRSDIAHPQAGQPVHLSFTMPQRTLEYVHERPIHLMIVSADLAELSTSILNLPATLTNPLHVCACGHYRAYADFTPPDRISESRLSILTWKVRSTPSSQRRETGR